MPFALVHGESLVAAASWALTTAGVELFDFNVPWESIRAAGRESGRPLVLHDPLCPLAPADYLASAVQTAAETGAVVVGVRPVTDTVKEYDGHTVGATVDRAELMSVATPVVLPAAVVGALESLDVEDFAVLVDQLRARFPMVFVQAPPLARRVADEAELAVLAALSAVS